ncbi:hypothetical protein [Fretibacter rubidus]|uniref:hypothetical protein n=1 Tax=Fretibacter rubidus TaxID=570162 RepID=UPI00352B9C44
MSTVQTASADDFDREGIKGLTSCFPAKYATEIKDKLADKSEKRRDVVDITFNPQFKIYDGGTLPDRFFLKLGQSEVPFTVTDAGTVPDFSDVVIGGAGEGDICIEDAARQGRPADDEGLYFEMGLTPYFQTSGPRYSLTELEEGTKDGKSLYKTMVPAVARMFMPDTDHLSVQVEGDIVPIVTAMKGEQVIGDLKTERYGEGYIFALDDVEDMGADAVEISTPHKLAPVPSIKTMRRFGIGEKKLYPELYKTDSNL